MKDADLYIFDDSFSALDFKTDAALRRALRDEVKGSAVLIIAQRINTILNADQIIVLDEGKIAGIGKHEELMERCSVYRQIADSQMKGGETDAGRDDTAVFEDEMEYSVPSNAAETVKRLWNVMGKQRIRLIIVAVSVLFYTVLSVAAPLYSAGIVDLLWGKIRQALGGRSCVQSVLGERRKRDHHPACDLYSYRDFVHVSELPYGELCGKAQSGTEDNDQSKTEQAPAVVF